MKRTSADVSFAIIALLVSADRGGSQEAAGPREPVEVQMRNVNLHLDQSIVLEIRSLRGQMVPTSGMKPVTLDDVNSFGMRIDSAEIAFSAKNLEVDGTLDVTDDGQIRFYAERVSSAHIPFKGLLHFFGKDLSKVINLKRDRGVTLQCLVSKADALAISNFQWLRTTIPLNASQ